MNRTPLLVSLAICLCLSACTGGPHNGGVQKTAADAFANDPHVGEPVDTVCLGPSLNGFYEVGNQALVVRRTVGEAYLLRTGFCPNLESIEGLDFEQASQCLKRGDRIAVYDTRFPRAGEPSDRPDSCTVLSIHEWHEDDRSDAPDGD